MALNVFEGARRISMLVGAVWIVGWVIAAFAWSGSSVPMAYVKDGPNWPFRASDESCSPPNARHWSYKTASDGTQVSLTLCFIAQQFDNGEYLIPYKQEPTTNRLWGNGRHSPEVLKYMESASDGFTIPQSDLPALQAESRLLRMKNIGEGALGAIAGLVFLYALTWTIGWVVRGFLGIPRGQDHRIS